MVYFDKAKLMLTCTFIATVNFANVIQGEGIFCVSDKVLEALVWYGHGVFPVFSE